MKSRLLQFIDLLRAAGIPITAAETLDAARAVAVVGIEPAMFREAAAATLVKDEADRATFEDVFDRFFAAPADTTRALRRSQPIGGGDKGRTLDPESTSDSKSRDKPSDRESQRLERGEREKQERADHRRRLAYLRALQDVPLKELTPLQIEECDVLLAQLAKRIRAHMHRRQRIARRGRIDLRRTIRRSIGTGGVPMFPQLRRKRPRKPDLVALCDMSHSVAVATRFLLALLAPAPDYFRRVRLFGYVDGAVEIWLEDGHLVQEGALDLYARSDFGRVLTAFWEASGRLLTRNTVLLILGDARNNRRPHRADLLARIESLVREVVWLNPEERKRWDTGDSVLNAYAPHCAMVLRAATLRELFVAVKEIYR